MGKQVMQKLIMIGSIILYNNLIKNLLKNKKKVITSIVLLKKTKDSTIQLFNQLPTYEKNCINNYQPYIYK